MKTINQYILEIERLALNDYLIEAQIDGLKDVKIIRHYTTGAGLKSILKDGYIEAKESKGDEDWEAYDLFDKKVVSFHDARTDPEWNTFIKANNKGVSMEGTTPTLGLHDKKVCACIEIDYEKLPELMQQKTHLLNIYGQKAENFANYWNCYVDETVKDKNGIVAWYACKADVIQLCKDITEGKYDVKMEEALNTLHDQNNVIKKWNDETAEPLVKEIEKIFKKHYPQKDLYEEIRDYSYHKQKFICYETSRYFMAFPWISDDENTCEKLKRSTKRINNELDESRQLVNFYSSRNFKRFEDDEIEQFKEMVIKFDVIGTVKMLKNHGWRFGDSNLLHFCGGRMKRDNGKYTDGSLGIWLDNLLKNKNRIINANIEIRIPCNVELNKENCKIILFNGICDATQQSSLKTLPKKYYDTYNIQHIEVN